MNSSERLKRRLKGETVDRPPNFDIFMTYAAHFINQPLSRYYEDYRVLCDANMAVLEAYGLDIVQAISDPYREAADFGLEVVFPYDDLPHAKQPLIVELEDIEKIKRRSSLIGKRMADRVEAVHLFNTKVGDNVPIMGWVEGALAEAVDLRGVSKILIDMYDNPDWLVELLEVIVETQISFANAQIEAGATMIGLGDAIASQISPKMYRKFVLPYEKRIFNAVHKMGALARLHICGNTTQILEEMVESGADIIDLDWKVDFQFAADLFGDRAVPCGNFDPVAIMLQGKPDEVYKATINCLKVNPKKTISAAGCEIPDKTPKDNLLAQKKAIQDFSFAV